MNIGYQLEAPDGLGSLCKEQRYYYAGRNPTLGVLLVWFYFGEWKRWRAACIHIPEDLFERELLDSPPGIRACKAQHALPPAIVELTGINFEELVEVKQGGKKNHKQKTLHRLEAIELLLEAEAKILSSPKPLKAICKISQKSGSKVHPHDLQYWFFAYILHSRNLWALKPATHTNGTWSREVEKHAATKFGRPGIEGARNGWSSVLMRDQIIAGYLRYSGLGTPMSRIYALVSGQIFGCKTERKANGDRHTYHPENKPFPTPGQFRYVVVQKFGLPAVQTALYGAARLRRTSLIDKGNTTESLANLLEAVEIDAYRCRNRAMSYRGEVMPELVVARALCATSSARVGIGFSLGGESQEAYRSMLWSMAVEKRLVAEAYGIPEAHLDWPIHGMCPSLLSDRGPGGQVSLIEGLVSRIRIKDLAPSYGAQSKPSIESSNPRNVRLEGQPSYLQSELHLGGLMKNEVLRAASENRSSIIVDKLSPKMISDFRQMDLPANPQALWSYLEQRLRTNALRMDPDTAVRAFLKPCEVTIDKGGAVFNTVHYSSPDFRESGVHESLMRCSIDTLKGYTLSLVSRLLWVECDGRLLKLTAMRRIRHDADEFFVSVTELEELAKQKKELAARTRAVSKSALLELVNTAIELTGEAPGAGRRKGGSPGRGKKGGVRIESNVLKAVQGRKKA